MYDCSLNLTATYSLVITENVEKQFDQRASKNTETIFLTKCWSKYTANRGNELATTARLFDDKNASNHTEQCNVFSSTHDT